MLFSLLVGFALGVATIIFALQNTDIVDLTFLGWQFTSSLALVIICATASGVVLGILASLPGLIQKSFRVAGLKKENKHLNGENERLQSMHREEVDTFSSTVDLRS